MSVERERSARGIATESAGPLSSDLDRPDAFWCPMHPDVRAADAGKCPLCGMTLVPIPPPRVGEYLAGDETIWEEEPLRRLAADDQLSAFLHAGFWRPMDTLRDKHYLEERWAGGTAPWLG